MVTLAIMHTFSTNSISYRHPGEPRSAPPVFAARRVARARWCKNFAILTPFFPAAMRAARCGSHRALTPQCDPETTRPQRDSKKNSGKTQVFAQINEAAKYQRLSANTYALLVSWHTCIRKLSAIPRSDRICKTYSAGSAHASVCVLVLDVGALFKIVHVHRPQPVNEIVCELEQEHCCTSAHRVWRVLCASPHALAHTHVQCVCMHACVYNPVKLCQDVPELCLSSEESKYHHMRDDQPGVCVCMEWKRRCGLWHRVKSCAFWLLSERMRVL